METTIWFWVAFNVFVLALLALDLGVFHRHAHAVTVKEAAVWSGVWVSLALLFNLGIYVYAGSEPAIQFFTGYLIEKSLAVDNIFVFVLIFSTLAVPAAYQHRVLFWGILSALVMRGILIALGAYLVSEFHWILYLFGAFLVITGIRMVWRQEKQIDLDRNLAIRAVRRLVPVTNGYRGAKFFSREGAKLYATPLFVALLMVEFADLVFAVDSIPAIFAVTQDPFLVYTSNVFAILGLRSMYFLLAGVIDRFHLLKFGLAFVLVFIGAKMLLLDLYKIPIAVSLGVVGLTLTISVAASFLLPNKHLEQHERVSSSGSPAKAGLD